MQKRIQGNKNKDCVGDDGCYEASELAVAAFPNLKCIFNFDSASAIQDLPPGPAGVDMRFLYSASHVVPHGFLVNP